MVTLVALVALAAGARAAPAGLDYDFSGRGDGTAVLDLFLRVLKLDAYDELPPKALWRNLWRTNNLEQYRPHQRARAQEDHNQPALEGSTTEAVPGKPNLSGAHFPLAFGTTG